MSARKSTSTEILKAAETVGAAAVCVGAAIMLVTSPEIRRMLVEHFGQPEANASNKPPEAPPSPRTSSGTLIDGGPGVVYLLKAGPFFKIGKAQDFDKRLRQIKLQLPYPVETIHKISCSDISHVESYWHRRFASCRQNGEWFVLTDKDVAEFKANARM